MDGQDLIGGIDDQKSEEEQHSESLIRKGEPDENINTGL